MKRLFLVLIYSAFSVIINAQTLYVKNTSNQCCLDVTNIVKWGATCNGSSYCNMTDIIGVGAGGSATQSYPTNCGSVAFINLDFQIDAPNGPIISTFYCGVSIFNATIAGYSEVYDLCPSGGGTSMLLHIHN